MNQIGSITEAIEAATMSQNAGWGVMVSHRSGETEEGSVFGQAPFIFSFTTLRFN